MLAVVGDGSLGRPQPLALKAGLDMNSGGYCFRRWSAALRRRITVRLMLLLMDSLIAIRAARRLSLRYGGAR